MTEQEQRDLVIKIAHTWLRTPYHHMGRVKGAGVDCAMLPAKVYEEAGLVPMIKPAFYPIDWHMHRAEEWYMNTVLQYAKETTVPGVGDLVLYRLGRAYAHGAIIVQWPLVIEARHPKGVQLTDMSKDANYADREHKFFTLWS